MQSTNIDSINLNCDSILKRQTTKSQLKSLNQLVHEKWKANKIALRFSAIINNGIIESEKPPPAIGRRFSREFVVTCHIGAYLPHAQVNSIWIEQQVQSLRILLLVFMAVDKTVWITLNDAFKFD